MDYRLKLEIATIEIWHIAAIIVSVIAFMMLYMKANRTASLRAFFYVQFTMILWMVSKILKTVSPTIDIRWSFIVLQYLAICLLEIAFLEFGYAYYKGKPIKKKVKILLYICPLIQFIIILTNPYHYLFYSRYDFWGDRFGIMFYVHFIIEYIYIVVGAVFCGIKFKKQFEDRKKAYMYLVSIGILAPIILNLIYVSKALHRFFKIIKLPVVFDITPIVFTWSLLLFVFATFKNEFFDLSPIMKHEIIYKLDTPICIVDSAGDIIFTNEQLRKNLNLNNIQELSNILEIKQEIFRSTGENTDENSVIEYNKHYYRIYSKTIRNLSGTQYVITFNEITSYVLIQNQLTEKNKELAMSNKKLEERIHILKQTSHIGARNYVARELHDIIGHSLVVTIKLLEVVKIFYKRDKSMVIDSLEKAKYSINSGFNEMKSINANKIKDTIYTGALLERELSKILKRVEAAGLKTNFYFRGKIKKMDEKIFDIIKKVCTELITNTLKHASASKLLLSLTFRDEKLQIYMMDDGVGSDEILKGNGLIGIDNRLNLIGGRVEYNSNVQEGFTASIVIPIT